MKELDIPRVSFREAFFACTQSITAGDERVNLEEHFQSLQDYAFNYEHSAFPQSMAFYPPLPRVSDDHVVIGRISKGELNRLYENQMVRVRSGRDKYDEILAIANDKCPTCGGIGQATTLDHYLPKSRYPQFSVLPVNLIPSCKDCNTGKGSQIALNESELPFHPYFDSTFMRERWISMDIINYTPLMIKYKVSPPEDWSEVAKERAINHFRSFNIEKRYGVVAEDEISLIKDFRGGYMRDLTSQDFQSHLLAMSRHQRFPNDWRPILYDFLSADSTIINTFDWI